MNFNIIVSKIINLIFPPVCAFCGKINHKFLCKECNKRIEEIEDVCIDTYNQKDIYYQEHIYVFKYEGFIREKLIEYKFNDKAYSYKTFVNILLNNKKICEILKSYDIIIPVPIHNKRKKERGYNQTELIAKEIEKIIENLEYENILMKKVNTKPQSTLNKSDRARNVKDVYGLKVIDDITKYRGKKILIFDDIYTTGSTVNECAKLLKDGSKKIGILTIAKD